MEPTRILIKYQKRFVDSDIYWKCYNVSIEYKEDMIILHFDQKQWLTDHLIHRDIIFVKNEIRYIRTRSKITKISHTEIKQ